MVLINSYGIEKAIQKVVAQGYSLNHSQHGTRCIDIKNFPSEFYLVSHCMDGFQAKKVEEPANLAMKSGTIYAFVCWTMKPALLPQPSLPLRRAGSIKIYLDFAEFINHREKKNIVFF